MTGPQNDRKIKVNEINEPQNDRTVKANDPKIKANEMTGPQNDRKFEQNDPTASKMTQPLTTVPFKVVSSSGGNGMKSLENT
jgi:hypothetical protein